jgi:hypothetical protein
MTIVVIKPTWSEKVMNIMITVVIGRKRSIAIEAPAPF